MAMTPDSPCEISESGGIVTEANVIHVTTRSKLGRLSEADTMSSTESRSFEEDVLCESTEQESHG